MNTTTKTLTCLTALCIASGAHADVLVNYDYNGGSASQTAGVLDGSNTTFGAFTGNASGSFGISSFSNVLFVRENATGAALTDGDTLAEAITNNAYATFTVTNNSGSDYDLQSLTFNLWFTSPVAARTYSIFGFSDVAGFSDGNQFDSVAVLGSDASLSPGTQQAVSFDLSSVGDIADGDAIAFRLYFVDEGDGTDPIFRVDDVTVNGVVPEPGSLALLGLGGLLVASRRRRNG